MTLEIRRTVRWGEEDDPTDIVPPFEVTVIVDEDNFTIQDITIRSTTGSASLSNEDIDALAHIFRKRGPQYL